MRFIYKSRMFAIKISSMKLNKATLKKIEELYKALGYKVRYEKGHFQAGYCVVQQQGVVVINKFYTTDVRINTLVDILQDLKPQGEVAALEEPLQSFWEELKQDFYSDDAIIDTKNL